LANEQFVLWALTSHIAQYIGLIDAGMAGSVSRILVDYKDAPERAAYGSILKTTLAVSVVQGLLILGLFVPLAPWLAMAIGVTQSLLREMTVLLIWQMVALGLSFPFRVPNLLLVAHQRLDILNLVQAFSFLVGYLVMFGGFVFGYGVVSFVWGFISSQTLVLLVSCWWCWRLNFLPRPGAWGRVSMQSFKELFVFARDMFLFSLGYQLINASQTILVTRVLGLGQAAVWSVCTRAFLLANQIVCKVLDVACPALAEMIARGEMDRLRNRFRSICIVTASLCVLCGIGFSVYNRGFVLVWTKGRFEWPMINDVLLSIWLLFSTVARCHAGLIGLTKRFGFLRYCYSVQGLLFVVLTLPLLQFGGISSMLCLCILTTLCVGYAYSTWRTSKYLCLPWRETAVNWLGKPVTYGVFLLPIALGINLVGAQGSLLHLATGTLVVGTFGLLLLLKRGLDSPLQIELANRMPEKFRVLFFP